MIFENIKTKYQFVKNRLKDISKIIKDVGTKYSIPINFKYIFTLQNPLILMFGTRMTEWATCNMADQSYGLFEFKSVVLNYMVTAHKEK